MSNELNKDQHEMLIDILIAATYGYHCALTGKEFKNEDAWNEYRGGWDLSTEGLKYPILRNIVQSTTGQILDLIRQSK